MIQANQVAVWLGPASTNSDIAIRKINNGLTRNVNKELRYYWPSVEASGILDLCQRSYWKRIWIVQEFILAKHIILYCGHDSLTWNSISSMVSQLTQFQRDDFSGHVSQNLFIARIKSSNAAYIVDIKQRYEQRHDQSKSGLALHELIESFNHMESTDFRNEVCGLLGLVEAAELEVLSINANYSKSAREIHDQLLEAYYCQYRWSISQLRAFSRLLKETMRIVHLGYGLESKLLEICDREEHLREESRQQQQKEERLRQERRREEDQRKREEEEKLRREEDLRQKKVGKLRQKEDFRRQRVREQVSQQEELRRRKSYPSVLKDILEIYDVGKMVKNRKLRHDVNFDLNLLFYTHIRSEKGIRKTKEADDFWTDIGLEFGMSFQGELCSTCKDI